MIDIKTYLFHDLEDSELKELTALYNRIRKETSTWKDKGAVSVTEFSDLIEVETIYILYDNDDMVGFLSYYVPDKIIHLFFLEATRQGSGLGSLLLEKVLVDFEGETIQLKCLIHNKKAIAFYQHKQFVITETQVLEDDKGYHLMTRYPS